MSIVQKLKSDKRLKALLLYLLMPVNQARPRKWVQWLVNPFFHHRGEDALIRNRTRMDVLPFNRFSIGDHSTIEDFSTVNNGMGDVIIGVGVRIGMSNVIIGPVTIGNNIILAQNVVVSALNHTYHDVRIPIRFQKCTTSPVTIEDDCWIGANAVITAGVSIGKHAVVAAGSIVTKNVPPFSIVAGNPAKVIKHYNEQSGCWEKVNSNSSLPPFKTIAA